MSLSSTAIATVRRLLAPESDGGFGRVVSLQRVTEGAYNPLDSSTGTPTILNYSAVGLPDPSTKTEVDGTVLRNTEVRLWLSTPTTGEVPEVGDTATVDGVVLRIISVKITSAQGANLIYELQCRT